MNKSFKVYVTKRALDGIEEREVVRCEGLDAVASVGGDLEFKEVYSREGYEWHRDLDDAVRLSEHTRQKLMLAYQAEIDRLKRLRWLCLINHADMVDGHYCVGRPTEDSPQLSGLIYWEFWTETSQTWTSAGTLYTTKVEAEAKLKVLRRAMDTVADQKA